jgi:intein/homing endonuclease
MGELMKKILDWSGDSTSVYKTLGASNHADKNRDIDDYYATPPKAVELLLEKEQFSPTVWENAVGGGHVADVLKQHGYDVKCSDIIDRGYPNTQIIDFLYYTPQTEMDLDIITNPPYRCFSEDTECYTKVGWKTWKQLTYDDEILSVNPLTLRVEWSKINEIIHYVVDEDMYHFKKSHLDILCTKDHRMFAFDKLTNKIALKDNDLIRSQNIRSTHYIPRTGYMWEGRNIEYFVLPSIYGAEYGQPMFKEEIRIPMKDWLKFFGLWLADGYCRHTKNSFGDERKTVGVKQIETNAQMIRDVLYKLPFNVKEYSDKNRKNPCINFEIHNEQLWSYLKQFGKSADKFVPREIKDLNVGLLQTLLDYYFAGDGSNYKYGRIYRTTSKHLCEDIQEILFKLGYLSHITSNNYTTSQGEVNTLYSIIYAPCTQYNKYYYPSAKQSIEHYNGVVWCVNLEKNGVFLLRRDGKEFICGNCAKQFVERSLQCVAKGHKVAMFLKLQFLEGKERRKLFDVFPPRVVYVSSSRLYCAPNGRFQEGQSSAVAYAWFVWEKGFVGKPEIAWIN